MPEIGRGIGGHDVNARWVDPEIEEKQVIIPALTEDWKVRHLLTLALLRDVHEMR